MTLLREIHIVDELKANILIGIDIMVPEGIDIITSKAIALIGSYKVEVPVKVKGVGKTIHHPVHAKNTIIILPYSET